MAKKGYVYAYHDSKAVAQENSTDSSFGNLAGRCQWLSTGIERQRHSKYSAAVI